MRIRKLAVYGFVGLFATCSPLAHAQSVNRDLEVSALRDLQVVLLPYNELTQLKKAMQTEKYSRFNFSQFVDFYLIRVRRFEHSTLRSNGENEYHSILNHNITLNYVIYFSCDNIYSMNQQRTIGRDPNHPRTSNRQFRIENACA